MRVSMLAVGVVIVLGSGCMFQNLSRTEHLRDQVYGINDDARWSRLNQAMERVHPRYRARYAATHRRWGKQIQIADMELLDMRLVEKKNVAVSVVAVSWYRYDTMTLHRSVVRQSWSRQGGGFALRRERVVDGDEGLLEPPARS